MLEKGALLEKALIEYNGDVERVSNVNSNSIIYDSVEKITEARGAIAKTTEVISVVDRFEKPLLDGYRDILLNVRIKGVICELRLQLRRCWSRGRQPPGSTRS
jgi:hypothetical protein